MPKKIMLLQGYEREYIEFGRWLAIYENYDDAAFGRDFDGITLAELNRLWCKFNEGVA